MSRKWSALDCTRSSSASSALRLALIARIIARHVEY